VNRTSWIAEICANSSEPPDVDVVDALEHPTLAAAQAWAEIRLRSRPDAEPAVHTWAYIGHGTWRDRSVHDAELGNIVDVIWEPDEDPGFVWHGRLASDGRAVTWEQSLRDE
jgi:hypothetical protein